MKALWEERAGFLQQTTITLVNALSGYAVANIIAIGIAVIFLYLPPAEAFATPWMIIIKNVPFVAIAGILYIALGDSIMLKVVIVILITFFPILANIVKGLNSADQVLLDRMQTLNASRWQVFWKVRWPFALPYYIASHEISFTGSIIGAILAEYMFPKDGLGFLIQRSIMQYRADKLFAVTLIASLLAVGAYASVKFVEKRLFRWKEGVAS